MTNLSPSSCLGIFVLAQLRLHLDLAETAKNYTIEHFREVMEGEEWLQLSPEHLTIFLDEPYLGCDNDGQLLKVKDTTGNAPAQSILLKTFPNHPNYSKGTLRHILFRKKIKKVKGWPSLGLKIEAHGRGTSFTSSKVKVRSYWFPNSLLSLSAKTSKTDGKGTRFSLSCAAKATEDLLQPLFHFTNWVNQPSVFFFIKSNYKGLPYFLGYIFHGVQFHPISQALLEWANHDPRKRTPHLLSFLDKIDLADVLPQVLIEVIQHPVVTGAPVIEKLIRTVLTNLIAKKFDGVDAVEENREDNPPRPPRLRCFHQQDVRFFFFLLSKS